MNQRLIQYSPEMEGPQEMQAGPLGAVAPGAVYRSGVFSEGQLLESAATLLEARGDVALERALDRLIVRAAMAVGAILNPGLRRALRSRLHRYARHALPLAGRTPAGRTTSQAARQSGLELEGLSPEDKEFELAKDFVRHAALAVRDSIHPPRGAADATSSAAGRPTSDFTPSHYRFKEINMHDIDRTQFEFTNEEFEFEQNPWANEYGGGLSEAEEMELATELLSVNSEAELDQFLGNLVRRATKAVGSFVSSPLGQSVGSVLKGIAKKAIPMAGNAIGGYLGGPLGAKIGNGLANAASNALGLEGEMAGEDREFEGAKQFVRIAAQTASKAVAAPAGADPRMIAQQAATAAARQLAPGLLSGATAPAAAGPSPVTASGRWLRRGNKIVIYGA